MKKLCNKIKSINFKKINKYGILNVLSYMLLWILGIVVAIMSLAVLSIVMLGM